MANSEGNSPMVGVTGAAGYIGSRVIHQLQEYHPDWRLIAIDNFYRGQVREIGDITIRHVDIRNHNRLEDVLGEADVIIHLAAVSGVDDCEQDKELAYEVNVVGTNNVAWICYKTGAGLIFPYSMAVLGDPDSFPITADLPRNPLNWYGRTKLLGERAIESFADDAFPAHLLLKSNLYGDHSIDGTRISKNTVINLFVNRVFEHEPLTVYAPGTQARNFVHVKDIANAYLRSTERLVEQRREDETGTWKFEIASNEDPSVIEIAERVHDIASEELGKSPPVKLIENPRGNETLVSEFSVDITDAIEQLGWEPTHSIDESIRELLQARTD